MRLVSIEEATMRTFDELVRLKSFEERFLYLQIKAEVGGQTFFGARWLNQRFYQSFEWKNARRSVLIRDKGFDLGVESHPILDMAVVHHMNPVTAEQLIQNDPCLYNPEFLISVSDATHKAIHYGSTPPVENVLVERAPFDTCSWRILK